MRNSKVLASLLFVCLVVVFSGFSPQTGDETVTCPVSGKVMKKSEAKATFAYQGKTYYFCCEGCKEKFIKDPEKYIQKKDETKAVYTCPMHPEVKADQPGKCPKCGMNLEKRAMPQEQGKTIETGLMACCQKMLAGGQGQGWAMTCPLHSPDVEIKTENLPDGIAVRVSSKNPDMVKKIQQHFATMKACCQKSPAASKQEEKE